jgi:hypothetical protein
MKILVFTLSRVALVEKSRVALVEKSRVALVEKRLNEVTCLCTKSRDFGFFQPELSGLMKKLESSLSHVTSVFFSQSQVA